MSLVDFFWLLVKYIVITMPAYTFLFLVNVFHVFRGMPFWVNVPYCKFQIIFACWGKQGRVWLLRDCALSKGFAGQILAAKLATHRMQIELRFGLVSWGRPIYGIHPNNISSVGQWTIFLLGSHWHWCSSKHAPKLLYKAVLIEKNETRCIALCMIFL